MSASVSSAAADTSASMAVRLAALERENRRLKEEIRVGRAAARTAAKSDVGGELFDQLFNASRAAARHSKRCATLKTKFRETREQLERNEMLRHDPLAQEIALHPPRDSDQDDAAGVSLAQSSSLTRSGSFRRGSSVGFDALNRAMAARGRSGEYASEANLDMPELSAAVPYLEARIKRSQYCESLAKLRAELFSNVSTVLQTSVKGVNAVDFIFRDATRHDGLLSCPVADFKVSCRSTLSEVATGLKGIRRQVDHACTTILDQEQMLQKERRQRLCDAVTQVTDEDMAVMRARSKIDVDGKLLEGDAAKQSHQPTAEEWKAKYDAIKVRCESLERSLSTQRGQMAAAESRSQASVAAEQQSVASLASSLLELHDVSYRAIHSVYKHRFRWCPNCPNHFSRVQRHRSSPWKPSGVVELVECTRQDVELLNSFAEYFVNDNLFGADLQHSGLRGSARRPTGVDASPRQQGAPLSEFVAFSDKENENTPQTSAKARPRSASAAGGVLHSPRGGGAFVRMEEWGRKQSAMWNARRSSMQHQRDVVPPHVRLDESSGASTPQQSVLRPAAADLALAPASAGSKASDATLPVPPPREAAGAEPFRRRHSNAF